MDTMCGWCYGFSDVITKIHEKYKDIYDFEIFPGGMWIGDNVKNMNEKLGDYIKGHNKRIEEITGKKFGEGFYKNILQNDSVVLDSFPGAKAVVLVQELNKDAAFNFLKKVQDAFFVNGKNMNSLETYMEIAKNFDISIEEFEQEFLSKALEEETFEYFNRAASTGASSFPTVMAVQEDKSKVLVQGYSNFEELDRILASLTF